jgi:hypothetical protein
MRVSVFEAIYFDRCLALAIILSGMCQETADAIGSMREDVEGKD